MSDSDGAAFETLVHTVRRLRAPDGCPWDRKQTPDSLIRFVLEEAYELTDALRAGDAAKICEELGDLLLLILLETAMGEEQQAFQLEDVIDGITAKIVRRHPHVFAESASEALAAGEIVRRWDTIKREERGEASLLASVPQALPALLRAQLLQERAARVGFDWDSAAPVLDKIREETAEIEQAMDGGAPEQEAAEIGDLLFAAVNLARKLGHDAEQALHGSNSKFQTRFSHIEAAARKREQGFTGMTLGEMDALWEEAKRLPHNHPDRDE